jgi:hypothetical protein
MKKTQENTIMALMACIRVEGQIWGPKPAMMKRIYLMDLRIRPIMSYAAFVW